jgi:hypothetical protein
MKENYEIMSLRNKNLVCLLDLAGRITAGGWLL